MLLLLQALPGLAAGTSGTWMVLRHILDSCETRGSSSNLQHLPSSSYHSYFRNIGGCVRPECALEVKYSPRTFVNSGESQAHFNQFFCGFVDVVHLEVRTAGNELNM